jgi:hypothetical protein
MYVLLYRPKVATKGLRYEHVAGFGVLLYQTAPKPYTGL